MACEVVEQIEPRVRERIIMTGLEDIAETIARISRNACSVLVLGETGVGKEIIARKIHDDSERRDKPFIALNVGGVDDGLLSSELFGHAKGAFTGAHGPRMGQFAEAEKGTIFLDEIGELAASSQVKLLRILQNGEYFPIGSDKSKRTDARVIAATNADIPKAVKENRLREDLLQRFQLRIKIPALRERGTEAMRTLAENFVFNFSAGQKVLSKEAMEWLCSKEQRWPGNVRQLESVLEMACLLAPNEEIMPVDLIKVYHDDGKFLRFEESLTCVDEGDDSNDEIIQLARRIFREGGIQQFRRNLMTTIVDESNSDSKVEGQTAAISPVSLVDKPDVVPQGDKEIFSEEKQRKIVARILEVYPMRRTNKVSSLESRLEMLRALVKTLETGQILFYSTVQTMTGLNPPVVRLFLKHLQDRIEENMNFVFYRERLGVRLVPKDRV